MAWPGQQKERKKVENYNQRTNLKDLTTVKISGVLVENIQQ